MLLDSVRYEAVINYGKDAINKLNENELEEGFTAAEKGWEAFPESGAKWNQGYNYAKMFYGRALQYHDMAIAKLWLDRMTENNDTLHIFDFEIDHMKAKYEFEAGNHDIAFKSGIILSNKKVLSIDTSNMTIQNIWNFTSQKNKERR